MLYTFIDWALALPTDLELRYHQEVEKIEEELHVDYITTAERIGMQKGEIKILLHQLERKFGEVSPKYLEIIQKANSESILGWSEKILEANNIKVIFDE